MTRRSPHLGGTYWRDFGERVRLARGIAGLTQEELGVRLDRVRASIANVEKGRQHVAADMVIALGLVLRVDPGWLLRGDPPGSHTETQTLLHTRAATEQIVRDTVAQFTVNLARLRVLADGFETIPETVPGAPPGTLADHPLATAHAETPS